VTTVSSFLYVYALDNAGTVELAWSRIQWDEGVLQSTTAEGGAGAADSNRVLYSTTARSNVPIRLIARLKATNTAGNWSSVDAISLDRETISRLEPVKVLYTSAATGSISGAIVDYATKVDDTHGAVTTGASWAFVAPRAGVYKFACAFATAAFATGAQGRSVRISIRKSASVQYRVAHVRTTTGSSVKYHAQGSIELTLAAGDSMDFYGETDDGAITLDGTATDNWVSICSVAA
jgi:hypothetical protein